MHYKLRPINFHCAVEDLTNGDGDRNDMMEWGTGAPCELSELFLVVGIVCRDYWRSPVYRLLSQRFCLLVADGCYTNRA
jgi:hypothetical protein